VVVVGYVLIAMRARRPGRAARRRSSGVATGVLLTLPNPAALGAWVAVAAAIWPTITVTPALVLALGVGLGSAVWFVLLARWIAKLPADGRLTRAIPKLAVVFLIAVAAIGIARAL
jgi:threonine/homoserine/homoserine lactone efflux protein